MLTTMCTTGQFRYRATVTKQLKKPIRTGVPRKTKIEWYTRHPFVNRWIWEKPYPVHFSHQILTKQSGDKKNIWLLSPVLGILLFTVLYIVAALLYPGGSQADKNARGFSWINNYWCNLLNEEAINGQHNPARPVALTAMLVLCVTLTFFWFLFPRYMNFRKYGRLAMQLSGAIAMTIAMFLFTHLHDIVIDVASVFGLVAFVGTFNGLYKSKWYGLFCFGIINLLLVALNNYLYYTKGLIIYLPVVQKITFASFLTWIGAIDLFIYWKTNVLLKWTMIFLTGINFYRPAKPVKYLIFPV